ncbi:vesicle transport through interaction with t-SNAREs homolog 1A [Drosophila guanche]|uniref:Blast:Vesicle transport through interaction with t-SNAREs homolog 1A n=1 Tax=Drosophila guanche TaxID=7266 RepID=A0A3B0KGF8_DROGU|nr:vesicle transport through interaction with t-SNAREs homolog 1A [Drosophila guanche]SPP87490.1 blast:Vesicle transport through interaction with t-SNAREs homolog 1A [Drosophila guanche]
MSLLEQYEQQYAALIAEITAHIGRLQQQSSSSDRHELCSKIDGSMPEAQELLEQMGLEVRELNPAQRSNFNSKLQVAQAELRRLQAEYKQTKDKQPNAFTTLDLGGTSDYYEDVSINNDQRQRLLDNSERIERTGNRLTEGYRVALETEALGAQVLNDLHHQRETLQGARARLRETNADIGRASRTLNTMVLRALREKVVLYGVGVCFVVAVGVSLYLTFAPSSTSAAASS